MQEAGWNRSAINSFVVKTGRETILFDAGLGPSSGGTIMTVLEQAGLKPADIDIICVTHMHGDHVGGLLNKEGNPAFAHAKVYIGKEEVDYWNSKENMEKVPESARGGFILAQSVINKYKDNLRVFNQNEDIVEGVKSVPTFGHTPGHTSFMVTSGKESILIWGDLMHAALQFAHPDVYLTYDVDPVMAVQSREKIFKQAAEEKYYVAGMHLYAPSVGLMEKDGDGYKFISGMK